MKMKASAITAAMLLALAAQAANAASAVGYNTVTVPANSDALVSVPFNKNVEGSFTVSSKTANGVTVADTLTSGAYANSYYVRFTSGSGEGLWSTISANGTGGFELANTDVLGYVSAGNTFRVYKHQTLSDLFPSGLAGVTFITAGDEGTDANGTQVLVSDASTGINKGSSKVCTHYGSFGWNDAAFEDANQLVLAPGAYVQVRNPSTNVLSVVVSGDVPDTKQAGILAKNTSNNDLYLANPFPVPVALNQMGLESWASTDDGETFSGQVLVYNNATSGMDKSSEKLCFYYTGDSTWYDAGFNPVNDSVPAGMGVVFRETSGTSGTGLWTVNKPY